MITTSSLQSALHVLLRHEYSALDLPIDQTDSMWERLEKDFQLTLGQLLSALRNYVIKSRSIAQSPTTTSSSSLSTGQVAPPPPDTKRPNKRKNNNRKKVGEEKPASTSLALQAEQFGIIIS